MNETCEAARNYAEHFQGLSHFLMQYRPYICPFEGYVAHASLGRVHEPSRSYPGLAMDHDLGGMADTLLKQNFEKVHEETTSMYWYAHGMVILLKKR